MNRRDLSSVHLCGSSEDIKELFKFATARGISCELARPDIPSPHEGNIFSEEIILMTVEKDGFGQLAGCLKDFCTNGNRTLMVQQSTNGICKMEPRDTSLRECALHQLMIYICMDVVTLYKDPFKKPINFESAIFVSVQGLGVSWLECSATITEAAKPRVQVNLA